MATADETNYLRNLFDALRDEPLSPTDSRYVSIYDRPVLAASAPIARLTRVIQFSSVGSAHLLVGARGVGKSTELRGLHRDLLSEGHVSLLVDVADRLDLASPIEVPEFFLHLTAAVGEHLLAEGVLTEAQFKGRYPAELRAVLEGAGGEEIPFTPLHPEARIGGGTRAAVDPSTRTRLLQRLRELERELLAGVRDFFRLCVFEVRRTRGIDARLVLLVDSLDHVRGTAATQAEVQASVERFLLAGALTLSEAGLHVVYTAPLWLQVRRASALRQFDGVESLAAIHVTRGDSGGAFAPGVEALRAVLAARGDINRLLGTSERVVTLIRQSGGLLRDLLALTREITIDAHRLPVSDQEVQRALAKARHWLQPLSDTDTRLLADIHRTKRLHTLDESRFEDVMRLLESHQVIAYRNGEEWYDVHPLIVEEVLARTKALSAEVPSPAAPPRPPLEGVVQFEALHVTGLRGFDAFELALSPRRADEGQWVVLLGENGVGKTTILRALVFALAEEAHASAALASSTVSFRRAPPERAAVELRASGHLYTAAVDVEADLEVVRQPPQSRAPVPFLVAYGCQRGSALGGPDRDLDFDPPHHIETLFQENHGALLHAESWLKSLRYAALDRDRPGGPGDPRRHAVGAPLDAPWR